MLSNESIKRLHPREYLRRFVVEGVRPDARQLAQFRSAEVAVGVIPSAAGSALVTLGETKVICGIKAEVAAPALATPDQGYLVLNVDLPPMASSAFRPGPPAPQAQTLSQLIADLHTRAPMIDMDALCIESGMAAWVLYADMSCLCYDGNVLDAALLALAAALKDVRLPKAVFNEEEGSVRADPADRSVELTVERIPLASTLATFDGRILADPTAEEEDLQEQATTVIVDGLNPTGPLLGMHKMGGAAVPLADLKSYIALAQTRAAELMTLLS
ncbi:hypothetical protein H9P43_000895 [Blastocladiella emersonii ATCC 22665]|nr:hypothetical protein H9P43_000895 [Blastocladiella emersonii ATCC 22665]